MKFIIKIILLLFAATNICTAQSTVILLPGEFDKVNDLIILSAMDGWIFREGNNNEWAKKDIDLSGWKKLSPAELSVDYADENGRVEGWFRIKIKPDSNFKYDNFGFRIRTWAAIELFVDGNLAVSSGNTGDGTLFRESHPIGKLPVPYELKAGNEYTIALHFVDYLAPLPPPRLKSESMALKFFLRLTGPNYDTAYLEYIKSLNVYTTLWISLCTVLSLLFWLLSIQKTAEKNLRLIALCTTCFTLSAICTTLTQGTINISYNSYLISEYCDNIFNTLLSILMVLILANIFKHNVTGKLKIFLVLFFLAGLTANILPGNISNIIRGCLVGALLVVSVYYIASSWKNLKGAQWAVVAGLVISLFWSFLYFLVIIVNAEKNPIPVFILGYSSEFSSASIYLYTTGIFLSFPLSLLVYVAIRFKEIINEVRQNAQQVMQMSEEKKEHALNQQKILEAEVQRQTAEIRTTLDNLKSTQAQLIQSEKMASLGELTAGIAHEIQNPLNFVNNFSEINAELISEMKEEIENENLENVKIIASNIEENEEKIIHHGKRAETIVKGMLQHSRTSTGVKEPTDINSLSDEYLRLAYHGLRAKDKSFNAAIKTDFDKNIDMINIVPQDIGRVILNIITNAFYAVSEKKKLQLNGYEPSVEVVTKKFDNKIEVKVKDNGSGIPSKVLDKIFQPFFTTKPTGQGTGLGLSLSYDILKAHGGDLNVKTKEGEGTEFIITLPI